MGFFADWLAKHEAEQAASSSQKVSDSGTTPKKMAPIITHDKQLKHRRIATSELGNERAASQRSASASATSERRHRAASEPELGAYDQSSSIPRAENGFAAKTKSTTASAGARQHHYRVTDEEEEDGVDDDYTEEEIVVSDKLSTTAVRDHHESIESDGDADDNTSDGNAGEEIVCNYSSPTTNTRRKHDGVESALEKTSTSAIKAAPTSTMKAASTSAAKATSTSAAKAASTSAAKAASTSAAKAASTSAVKAAPTTAVRGGHNSINNGLEKPTASAVKPAPTSAVKRAPVAKSLKRATPADEDLEAEGNNNIVGRGKKAPAKKKTKMSKEKEEEILDVVNSVEEAEQCRASHKGERCWQTAEIIDEDPDSYLLKVSKRGFDAPKVLGPWREINPEREWKAEMILEEKNKGYIVQWGGHNHGEPYAPSWTQKENVCRELIQEWMASQRRVDFLIKTAAEKAAKKAEVEREKAQRAMAPKAPRAKATKRRKQQW